MGREGQEEAINRRNYETFIALYRGREDVIAELRDGKYHPLLGMGGLTFERFQEHVKLEKTYAIYNRDNEGRVHFGLFDVDVLPRTMGWKKILAALDEKREETKRIMATLEKLGLKRKNILLEFPTVGYHILVFFTKPVAAGVLKRLMTFVLEDASLPHIPFYPHDITERPWGDRVPLPLRVNQNTGKRSVFLRDLDVFDPENYDEVPDFSILEEVEPVDESWVTTVVSRLGLKTPLEAEFNKNL